MIPEEEPVWGTEITREMVDPGYGNMWSVGPGPLKCFCASPHQIFAKSASQNARNRDKADFTTKVRKLRINWANVNIEQ